MTCGNVSDADYLAEGIDFRLLIPLGGFHKSYSVFLHVLGIQ